MNSVSQGTFVERTTTEELWEGGGWSQQGGRPDERVPTKVIQITISQSYSHNYIKEYKCSMKVSHLHDCQDKD